MDKEYTEEMPVFYLISSEESVPQPSNNHVLDGKEIKELVSFYSTNINESKMPEGRIYVHPIFLSEGEFKDGEKMRRMRLIEDAERWIE